MRRTTATAALLCACLLIPHAGAPAQTAPTPRLRDAARAIVDATNQFRRSQGMAAVAVNSRLDATAREFAEFMARTDRYGHDADGREPPQRAQAHGYAYCMVAENIAYEFSSAGFSTDELARELVEGWKNSPGHRRNMLDDGATESGVGIAQSPRSGRFYAVQMFGRPRAMQIRFSLANRSALALRYQVGANPYVLAPRTTRTHEQCRADSLVLHLPGAPRATRVVPSNGGRYRIEPAGNGVRLAED